MLLTALALASLAPPQAGGPVLNPATGHHYLVVEGTVPWPQAKQDAEQLSFQGVSGHLVTYDDLAEDQWVYHQLTGGPLGNAWIGLYQDDQDPGFVEPGGGWKWVTGEPMTWSNWTAGEPNNSGNAEHYGGYWPSDRWNDYVAADGAVARYVVEFDTTAGRPHCHGDGSGGFCPCGNLGATGAGCANSQGPGATAAATGTASVTQADLGFTATGLVPGQAAILFEGVQELTGGGLLFGDGLRCAGGALRRLGVRLADAGGGASWAAATLASGPWSAGAVRQFQVWYADPFASPCGAGFNTSNALEVGFLP